MKSIILRVLFIIAVIIIIIVLAFGIIRFIPAAFSSFANVGKSITSPFTSGGDEILVETNNPNIKNGDEFTVYWDYETESEGKFFLNYPCIKDLKVNVIYSDGNRRLLCNTQYPVASGSIDLEADLTKADSFADLPIEISFVENKTKNIEASGKAIITVANSDTPVGSAAGNATIIGEPIDNGNSNNNSSNSNNDANSSVSDSNSGRNIFTPSNTYVPAPALADLAISNARAIDDLTVQFDIYNIGGRPTGNWVFNYATPDEDVENSPLQRSLNPGEGIRFTLSIDSSDRGVVAIAADSTNSISELSESNNIATINIRGGNNSGSGDYSYDRNDDADLEIDEMEVGRMSGSRFIEDDNIDEGDDAAVRFVVVNRGGESTGSYRFEINDLPFDNGDDNYRSNRQDSLRPGESVEIIVEFKNPDEGRYNIEVEVDSDDDVNEENERNNDESQRLDVDRR